MVSSRDVEASVIIEGLANILEKEMKKPEWAEYVKTGVFHQRPPETEFWYVRSASILRKVYLDGPVGVMRLRSFYGGRKNMGRRPSRFKKGSGKIVRTILQDLEKLGYIETVKNPNKGRRITPKGQKIIESVAKNVKV
ncbi:MAG: 30S ribosomal protein S19e [Candidatus Aenigmarchaeota archaeon]|nr:30S ribosomal protein S19e [Candidatus Aenigmarchaeota archaeon]